jgi:hypothetical protein
VWLAIFLGECVVVVEPVVLDAFDFDEPLLHALATSATSEHVATARIVVALTPTRVLRRCAHIAALRQGTVTAVVTGTLVALGLEDPNCGTAT